MKVRCLNCRDSIELYRETATQKYCSNNCQQQYQRKLAFAKIRKLGKLPKGMTVKLIKTYLIFTRGHRCKLCKRTTWRGYPVPLVMDHMDGNPYDWKLTNLRLICHNCDAQTDTYKGRNRGYGRHSRRVRYAEGKSY